MGRSVTEGFHALGRGVIIAPSFRFDALCSVAEGNRRRVSIGPSSAFTLRFSPVPAYRVEGGGMRVLRRVLGVLAVLTLVLGSSAHAQTVSATTGAINGRVADNTGAVLPGVTVTIRARR